MKRLVLLSMVCLMATAMQAQTVSNNQSDSLIECRIVVGDYYFYEVPMGVELDSKFVIMDTLSKQVIGLYPDTNLTADDIRYAIPPNRVKNLAEVPHLIQTGKRIETQKSYQTNPKALKVGDTIGAFNVTDTEGNNYTEASTLGHPLVLNFWFTGCGPCIKEMPIISQWTDSIPSVTYLSVTYNSPKEIGAIVKRQGFRFKHITNDKVLSEKFYVRSYPLTVVIDKRGIIRLVMYGTSTQKRDVIFAKIKEVNEE